MVLEGTSQKSASFTAAPDFVRTVALFSVVLYHVQAPGFAFGNIGVDIFVLLSGYLIGHGGSLSVTQFIRRRMFRLLRPLGLIALLMLFAMFFFSTPYNSEVSAVGLATSLLGSNYWFSSNVGYFNADVAMVPAVHLWSLSVEVYCYVATALVLLIKNADARIPVAIIFFLCLMVIFFADYVLLVDPYYNATQRYLAFLLGVTARLGFLQFGAMAVIYMIAVNVFNSFYEVKSIGIYCGLSAIVVAAGAFIAVSNTQRFSAYGHRVSVVLRFIADNSYEIYLFHWFFISLWVTATLNGYINHTEQVIMLVASICGGVALRSLSLLMATRGIVISVSLAVLIVVSNMATSGWAFRYSGEIEKLTNQVYLKLDDDDIDRISENSLNLDERSVVYLGDSHARHFFALDYAAGGRPIYRKHRLEDLDLLLKDIDTFSSENVYVAFRWSGENPQMMKRFFSTEQDAEVTIVGEVPNSSLNLLDCFVRANSKFQKNCDFEIEERLPVETFDFLDSPQVILLQTLIEQRSLKYIDPADNMCNQVSCIFMIDEQPVYRDNSHLIENLKPETAKFLSKIIFEG